MLERICSPEAALGFGAAIEAHGVSDGDDVARVRVTGELDIATAAQLEETLRDAERRAQRLVLDLRDITFMDSCGVRTIVEAHARAKARNGELLIVPGPAQVDRVFALTGTAQTLSFVDLP
jgi:anti-sigma B factor antagonist